jgi:predicted outer membrane repeat protein
MNLRQLRTLLPIALCVTLLVSVLLPGTTFAQGDTANPPIEPLFMDAPAAPDIDFATPMECIRPLRAAHIAAAIASVLPLPIPGFKTAADMAEFGANLALKGCPPDLVAPKNIVKPPPPNCELLLTIPLDATYNELNQLDEQFFGLLLQRYHVPADARGDIIDLMESEYGRFENETYGSYSNVYGIELPLELSDWSSGNYGDVGAPEIYHYNTDVHISLLHPGKRIDENTVVLRPGSYTLSWRADTLISAFDWIPTFLIPGSDSPSGQKAAKEAATEASKRTVKEAVEEAAKETTSQFVLRKTKELALNIAKKGGAKVGATALKLRQPYFVSGTANASTYATQRLFILDTVAPTIQGGDQLVVVEAFLPGGASAGANMPGLLADVTVSDNCDLDPKLTYNTPAFWPLQVDAAGNPLPSATITWTAQDRGAATDNGGVNSSTVSQQVIVVDTLPPIIQPPPPVIREATGNVEVALGAPQVFDVADLRPSVTYAANSATAQGVQWPLFGPGVHYVDWSATDRSGNRSEVKQQLVNIKPPGTNLPPVAIEQRGNNTIQAVADEPIKITVRGADGNNPPDPLWFTVEDHPLNGYFIAPLYPYFIDDYRMTARYSPQIAQWEGEEFAWQVAASQEAMRQYIISLCEEDISRTDLPKDFVSWNGGGQKYMAVDDANYSYIYDWAYRRCTFGGSTIAPNGSERISVWDPDGLYIGEIWRGGDSRPLRDINFNVGQGTILAVNSDGSSTGDSLVNIYTTQPQNAAEPIAEGRTYSLWNKINRVYVPSEDRWREPQFRNAASAAWDTTNNVLYVAGEMNLTGLAAFQPAPCTNDFGQLPDPPGPADACLNLLDVMAYSISIRSSTATGDFPGVGDDALRLWNIKDLAVDSTGALYVVANSPDPATSGSHNFHRIYKFAAATRNEDGSMNAGDLIGWMGRCSTGSGCNYIDQHSIGFSCTDATCALEGDFSGSGPGQFNKIAAIAIDPNDVLYVADSGNERVQRFNSDGLFAGEARSQSSCAGCTGFVLGDFGSPGNISVNSSNFYIIDVDTELVHIFEASVIHSIDNTSAWVEYRSDTNYVGADSFTFRATDGFRTADGELIQSAPAQVDINVNRNFRPPQAQAGLAISTTEDTPTPIRLAGYDLDGNLDTLTYRVTMQPGYGRISDGADADRIYTPDEDFYGDDSFTYVVHDGRFDSEPMTVPISVAPVNDPPAVIIRTAPLATGVGFPFSLDAQIVDADWDDTHLLLVEWGDGAVEEKGDIQEDGSLSGPVILPDSTFTSTILGFHTYTSAGDKSLRVCAIDTEGLQGCDTRTVAVQDQVDLVLSRQGHAIVPDGERTLTYALTVENRAPQSGGVTASTVLLEESLAKGASYRNVDPNGPFTCVVDGRTLRCPIGDLAVGSQAQVIITVALDASLDPGAEIAVESSVASNSPEAIDDNNALLTMIALLPQADFYVVSLGEGGDLSPGDGVCAATDGCTLRAAIEEANATEGAQTIALGYGVHQLNLSDDAGRLRVAGDELLINDAVTIVGLSADRTVVNANSQSRIITVRNSSATLRNMMLTGGATSGDGGAIVVESGDATLEAMAVAGNRSEGRGGGVMVQDGATLTIRQSAFTDNRAATDGGAIWSSGRAVQIENSTFSRGNADRGGAIRHAGGTLSLTNVTLVGNSAATEGGAIHADGDGISISNTILSSNGAPLGSNCLGRLNSGGHNLLGDLDSCTILGQTGSNILSASQEWRNLARTFADTYAYDLTPQSQAVDAGNCQVAADQRGVTRPAGNKCDIGAIEYDPSAQLTATLFLPSVMR